MSSKTARRSPKLRASCDGCYRAKVKCKGTPTGCLRCISQDLECIYSPSMRNQTYRKGDGRNSNSRKTEQHNDHLYQDSLVDNQDSGHVTSINDYQEGSIMEEQKNFMSSMLPYDDMDMTMWDGGQQHSLQGQPGLPISSSIPHAIPPADSDFNMISNLNDVHHFLNTVDPTSRPLDQLYPENSDIFSWSFPSKSITSTYGSMAPDPSSKCHCFTDMLQAIEISRSQSPRHNADAVMNHNRQAMARVCGLLRCKEEHDTMVGLLVLVLISKILNLCESIYNAQQGAETDGDSPSSTAIGTASGSSTSLSDLQTKAANGTHSASSQRVSSISSSSGFSLSNSHSHSGADTGNSTPTRLTFGSHEFDQDDEDQLKTQMMLIRLVKLKSLLNRFNEAQWTGGKSMMDVSSTMRGILLDKVEAVMECMQMSVKL